MSSDRDSTSRGPDDGTSCRTHSSLLRRRRTRPPHRRQTARTRIDDEHRQLGELLASLAHTHDLHRVAKLLADLHTLLVRHFEGEEGAQGLHSVVGEGASPTACPTCSTSSTIIASSSPASTR
jgi:hypothetical protein